MNLPNSITLFRIVCIPIFILLIIIEFETKIAFFDYSFSLGDFLGFLVFLVLSFTDWLDGYLARKLNSVTNFGKFLDPLADKLLTMAGFILLVELNLIPAWVVILIISREMVVTGLRLIAASEGTVIAAANMGKLKTTLQIVVISLLLLQFQNLFTDILIYTTLIVTVVSGIDYFNKNKHVFKQ